MDLQRCEIELVEIILGFFFYGSGKLFFLFGKVSFGRSQPACNNVKSGPVSVTGCNLIERLSSKIELSKAQRRGNEIELTVRVFWAQTRNLFTP